MFLPGDDVKWVLSGEEGLGGWFYGRIKSCHPRGSGVYAGAENAYCVVRVEKTPAVDSYLHFIDYSVPLTNRTLQLE